MTLPPHNPYLPPGVRGSDLEPKYRHLRDWSDLSADEQDKVTDMLLDDMDILGQVGEYSHPISMLRAHEIGEWIARKLNDGRRRWLERH